MKVSLSRMKKTGNNEEESSLLSQWIGPDASKDEVQNNAPEEKKEPVMVDNRPIEPERSRFKGSGILKWIIFLLFIGYAVISYYRVPILTALGDYLILEHPLKKADLIVCTPGPPLEQSLTAAELYQRGLAPRIFIPQETAPDGLDILKEKGGRYPEGCGLIMATLKSLNVPESAWSIGTRAVDSVREEAEELHKWLLQEGGSSMIVVTSPSRARSTYRIFKKVLDGKKVEIMIAPSRYAGFKADSWWKRDRYISDVIIEYQKLAYYAIKGLW